MNGANSNAGKGKSCLWKKFAFWFRDQPKSHTGLLFERTVRTYLLIALATEKVMFYRLLKKGEMQGS